MSESTVRSPTVSQNHVTGVRLLRVGFLATAATALVMVATPFANALFSWLVFGSADSWATTGSEGSYVEFSFAILGAAMLGWMVALWWITNQVADLVPGAWQALAASVATWFVIDSSMSLLRGYPVNLAVNLLFLLGAFAPGLWLTRPDRARG